MTPHDPSADRPSDTPRSMAGGETDARHPSRPPPDWQRPDGVAPGTWAYVHSESIAAGYDDFVRDAPMIDRETEWIDEHFPPGECRTVADFGCGTGRVAIPLAQRGYRVEAIDLSQPMLDRLTSKAAAADVTDRIEVHRGNLADLGSLPNAIADDGLCLFATLGMIQGASHRQSFLRHAHRLIRPGGRLLVHVHHRWAMLSEPRPMRTLTRSCYDAVMGRMPMGDATYAYRGLAAMYMHRFTRRELRSLLRHAGWSPTRWDRLAVDPSRLARASEIAGGFFVVATRK